jgi:DNA-binding response OmpR family regulator
MSQILLIDDSSDLLNILNWSLHRKGYTCSTAYYRAGIMYELSRVIPSLIIMDINLGNDDGRKICRGIKKNPATRHIPVILCSGNHELLLNYKSCLADDFIEKPFAIDEVIMKIENLIKS